MGEGCGQSIGRPNCSADCRHQPMIRLCESNFGRACTARRKPFAGTGAPYMVTDETFCVPRECMGYEDQRNLPAFFQVQYLRRRAGWYESWNDVELICPDQN